MSKVVSFRVTEAAWNQFESIREMTGMRMGETVRAMLQDPKTMQLVNAAREQGYAEGMKKWLGKAYVPCCVCGKDLPKDFIGNPKHRQILLAAFKHWGHKSCLDEAERRHQRHMNR